MLNFCWDLAIFDKFGNVGKIEGLRKTFLNFMTQGWLSQITADERGMIKYRKWQEILETEKLFKEVESQIKAVDEANDARRSEI